MFYEKMLGEKRRLLQEIQKNQEEIDKLPEGTFYCIENGRWDKWYENTHGREQYIPKTNQLLAARLAYKRYLVARNEDLARELSAVEAYLGKYPKTSKAEALLVKRGYGKLLQTFWKPQDEELKGWMKASFQQNPYKPEHKIHHVYPGLSVRSKSEAMIATQLHINRIPFRYECALYLDKKPVYPDFTIRHPKTGETYFWEHLGLLDNPAYCRRAVDKIYAYAQAEIYLNRELILTVETKDQPFTIHEINRVIRDKFL